MGCPDSVMVPCPGCNRPLEFQSKGGDCTLTSYTLENAPADVMKDVNRHAPISCPQCSTSVVVDPVRRRAYQLDPYGLPEPIRDQLRSCYVCGKEQAVSEFNLSIDRHASVGEFGDAEDLYICDADVTAVLEAVARVKRYR